MLAGVSLAFIVVLLRNTFPNAVTVMIAFVLSTFGFVFVLQAPPSAVS